MTPFGDFIIYVDESGDHGLASIDRDYPVFVLCFCIFRKDHYTRVVAPAVQSFKFAHFGHDIVVLHEREIRKQTPPFAFLQIRERRDAFMAGLNSLVAAAEFTIVSAAIHKERLTARYSDPDNPYEIALLFCMERAHRFLGEHGQRGRTTHVVVERRGRREDDELELAFRRIKDGTAFQAPMPDFEIVFADKKTNSAGLQLADLTARPIGRHVLNPAQPNRAWDLIEPKMRRSAEGLVRGWGLKVFP